ncbi:MAG: hypothetical protein JXO49_00570 [Deltaproteobacteria bacterium]|nr:hypothetical protein [Candidatus Anaeroferrophillus wilburensis]MBN2887818.1 hypothetical protein [Deltaproteobacteria bacterium]
MQRKWPAPLSVHVLLVLLVMLSFMPLSSAAESGGMIAFKDALADFGIDSAGFFELRGGGRLADDDYEQQTSLAEARLQLELGSDLGWGIIKAKGDLLADTVTDDYQGELRELSLLLFPLEFMDVKLGRQVLTWGTGDLLFINDFFPKDWKSFFIGRDAEYLKAPSDAVKVSMFFDLVNVDLVYVPLFNGSDYIDGERLSYWNPVLGRTAGRDYVFPDEDRDSFFAEDEWAFRLHRTIRGVELALYGYQGYWKTPEGLNPVSGRLIYPMLRIYGASMRGALLGGLGNLEAGYYDSRDDRQGDDPLIRNSEWRFLAGYERELGRDFTGGIQYYLEAMADYKNYRRSLPAGAKKADELRSVITLRLTRLLLNQNLILSCFTYYSPTDNDAYLRPTISYKINDYWLVEGGANLFFGADEHTFFGQFQDNTNAYLGLRVSF